MKLKIKNLFIQACFIAGGALTLTSCNDFLDREPLSSVTPEVYFQTVDHFAAYSIAKYQNYFPVMATGVLVISVIAITSLKMLCLNMKRVKLPERMLIFVIILEKCI